jgi:hypothetical protein
MELGGKAVCYERCKSKNMVPAVSDSEKVKIRTKKLGVDKVDGSRQKVSDNNIMHGCVLGSEN